MTMRYVCFSDASRMRRPGTIEGRSIRPFGVGIASIEAFIAMDPRERAAALATLGTPIPAADVVLHAPLRPKKNVFCVGRNYLDHITEGARTHGGELKLPAAPAYFTKAPTAISDPDEVLKLSSTVSGEYDWEAELAIVIGTTCRDLREADALSAVFGYTALNDVTARDLQRLHLHPFKGKSLDNTCPVGPWIVDAAEVGNAQALDIVLRVNGVEKQRSNTANMIFSIARIVANLSQGLTLEPGDLIATGTPDGVGYARTPPEFLADGDVMEVVIEKIGVLRNAVQIGPSEAPKGRA